MIRLNKLEKMSIVETGSRTLFNVVSNFEEEKENIKNARDKYSNARVLSSEQREKYRTENILHII